MLVDHPSLSGHDPRLVLWCMLQASSSAYQKLTLAFGSAELALREPLEAWKQTGIHASHLKRLAEPESTLAKLQRTFELLGTAQIWVCFKQDPEYPALLKHVDDAPPLLFGRGRKSLLADIHLAVVGSRSPTPSARSNTEQFVQQLCQSGLSIVSGLAAGIDATAHAAALKAAGQTQGAQTVAVLGSGVDLCYPPSNQKLLEDMLDQGACVISEYLPGTRALKHHFPRRNRIISGMSIATLVMEAAQRSGSLITASMAAEFGRSVFAVPGFIGNQKCIGCFDLIRGGATLCYRPEQVLEDLSAEIRQLLADQPENSTQAQHVTPLGGQSKTAQATKRTSPLLELLSESLSLDELVAKLNQPIHQIIEELTLLEISGEITQQAGRYQRTPW